MTRWIAIVVALVSVAGVTQAYAQESAAGPAPVVVTIIPGGATFFSEGNDANGPSFGNYGLGAGVTYNINRFVGVEGRHGSTRPTSGDARGVPAAWGVARQWRGQQR